MPKYIDESKIQLVGKFLYDMEDGDFLMSVEDVRRCIRQTPAEDVVEVVRCGACRHYAKHRIAMAGSPEGWNYCYCGTYPVMRRWDEYCSRGEVRKSK